MLLLALACTKTPTNDSGLACDPVDRFEDRDGDGFGAAAAAVCPDDEGYVDNADDCDDANAEVHPDATEVCNELDDDCDGSVDEDVLLTFYEDLDDDGYGTDVTVEACEAPDGYADQDGDCDDEARAVNPGGRELCNGTDEDCDGETDEDAQDGTTYFDDQDDDGYAGSETIVLCEEPSWGGAEALDCDDEDSEIHPGKLEWCGNDIDDDCDGTIDQNAAYFEASDGTVENATGDVTGTAAAPATPTFSTEGDLVFCPGTYYLNATVENSLFVRSADVDATTVELNGGLEGTIFEVTGEGITASFDAVTFADGYGSSDVDWLPESGGAIACGGSGSELYVENSTFRESLAFAGGAICAMDCDVFVAGSTFDTNLAEFGGAVLVDAASVTISESVFSENEALSSGGALYALGYIDDTTVTIDDSSMTGNLAQEGGAVVIDFGAYVTYSGSGVGASSVTENIADEGAVEVYGHAPSGFVADNVDFGTAAGGDDNALYDVVNDAAGFAWMPQDSASFSCDEDGCGTSVSYTVGGTTLVESAPSSNAFVGQVITADVPATLDAFEIYLEDVDSCSGTFYLLSAASSTATTWTVEWSEAGTISEGWSRSPDIGLPVDGSSYYATGLGVDCASAPSYAVGVYGTAEDAGLGDVEGNYTYDLDYTGYSGTATTDATDPGVVFYTRLHVTEL